MAPIAATRIVWLKNLFSQPVPFIDVVRRTNSIGELRSVLVVHWITSPDAVFLTHRQSGSGLLQQVLVVVSVVIVGVAVAVVVMIEQRVVITTVRQQSLFPTRQLSSDGRAATGTPHYSPLKGGSGTPPPYKAPRAQPQSGGCGTVQV